jgi:predicted membrane-bound dolichyl-phosphate-mannose-protein mannosyltransferase
VRPGAAANPWLERLKEHGPIALLVAIAGGLRAFRVGDCGGALIGDEVWYVQAARVIAGVPVLMHHLPSEAKSYLDPNSEHPPLAKAIIAGMIKLMGDREVAWRIPSVVLGTLSVWLVYRIVLALAGNGARMQALFAAFIVTFENMFLIHGRIATLDIYLMGTILLGTWVYLIGYLEIAAVIFAVGALCKANAVLGLAAVLFYELLMARSQWRHPNWRAVGRRAVVVGLFVAAFLIGLGALDCFFTEYRSPFAHLAHMREYHQGFKHVGKSSGAESTPLDWWLNAGAFDYYSLTSPHKNLLYRAAMNFYVIGAAPLAIAYAARQSWTERSPLATFAVASVLANFAPIFMAWAVFSRTSYIYYMLPIVPAVACALAVGAYALPRSMRWVFAAMFLYGFAFSYPVRFF